MFILPIRKRPTKAIKLKARPVFRKRIVVIKIAEGIPKVKAVAERLLSKRKFSTKTEFRRAIEDEPEIKGSLSPHYVEKILKILEQEGFQIPKSKGTTGFTEERMEEIKKLMGVPPHLKKAIIDYYNSLTNGNVKERIAKTARHFGRSWGATYMLIRREQRKKK